MPRAATSKSRFDRRSSGLNARVNRRLGPGSFPARRHFGLVDRRRGTGNRDLERHRRHDSCRTASTDRKRRRAGLIRETQGDLETAAAAGGDPSKSRPDCGHGGHRDALPGMECVPLITSGFFVTSASAGPSVADPMPPPPRVLRGRQQRCRVVYACEDHISTLPTSCRNRGLLPSGVVLFRVSRADRPGRW